MIHRRGKHDRARAEPRSRGEQHIAVHKILTTRADVLARHGVLDQHTVSQRLGVFLDDHRVGPVGHRRAREDPNRLAGLQDAVEARTGCRRANEGERRGQGGQVGGTNRVAVHGRGIERRLGERRAQILGQHALCALRNRNALDTKRRQPRRVRSSASSTEVRAIAYGARNVPERPPIFSIRRIPEKLMARSTALHMS